MAVLQVFQNGEKIKELALSSDREFIIGRSSSSDLVLEGDRGISRQHLKVFREGGKWVVEVLSRFGELYQNGQKVNSLVLENGTQFEVPPFELKFEGATENSYSRESNEPPTTSLSMDSGDRTYVGGLTVIPFLKVCDDQGQTVQVFQLEGQSWVGGRDVSCTVFIDNSKFSRRHFEIRFEEGAYLIKDLGSSNGTLLNDQTVSTSEWTQLRSGDVITVVDWNLYFELRDPMYSERLQEIPQEFNSPILYVPPEANPNAIGFPQEQGMASQQFPQPPPSVEKAVKKTNYVRLAIYVVIILAGLGYYLTDDGNSQKPMADSNGKTSPNAFEKLTPQQQQYVKDTYRLADRLFKEARFEMARQEVTKIHQLVPYYEESKNIEKLADIAIQTKVEQQKAEVREREMAEMEAKIQKTVEDCEKAVTAQTEMNDLEECLGPVIPLNPDHASILSLRAKVDQMIAERTERREKLAEYQSLVRKLKSQYEKANALLKSGKPLEAISVFEIVVQAKLPDPGKLKPEAKRQIASIQKNLMTQQSHFEKEAEQAQKKGELKASILMLQKALEINPENETLKGKINSQLGELKKQMQVLYQEGVLEESVGEVETAKLKWKKIVETSLPEEDYYKKARIKLKKYGAE